jgi:serine/threonine protein phosphatase 1
MSQSPASHSTPPGRTIAIGDIHGCLAALHALLQVVDPQPEDTVVTLGDYVDRGPDSRGVIDRLLMLACHCQLVPLLGNHDEMMRQICEGDTSSFVAWLMFGGDATALSYGGEVPAGVPKEHVEFLRGCLEWFELEHHFFVHASYRADLPLQEQPRDVLLWESLRDRVPGPHISGKTAIVGHTAQRQGEILDLGYLKCIDTCCYGQGWLTAMDVNTGQVWQSDKEGRLRDPR